METSFGSTTAPRTSAITPPAGAGRRSKPEDSSFDADFAVSFMSMLIPATPLGDPAPRGTDGPDESRALRDSDPSSRAADRADRSHHAQASDSRAEKADDGDSTESAAATRADSKNASAAQEAQKPSRPSASNAASKTEAQSEPAASPKSGAAGTGTNPDAQAQGERGESAMLRAVRRIARDAAIAAAPAVATEETPTPAIATPAAVAKPVLVANALATPVAGAPLGTGEAMRAWEARLAGTARPGEPVALRLEDGAGASATLRLRVRGDALQATLLTSNAELATKLEQDMQSLQESLRARGFTQAQMQVTHTGAVSGGASAHDARNQKEGPSDQPSSEYPRPNDRKPEQEGGDLRRQRRFRGEGEVES
jgi:hypothetical protein